MRHLSGDRFVSLISIGFGLYSSIWYGLKFDYGSIEEIRDSNFNLKIIFTSTNPKKKLEERSSIKSAKKRLRPRLQLQQLHLLKRLQRQCL